MSDILKSGPDTKALQEALTGRFDNIRPLGSGSMAHVCLAHDVTLDRDVAIKFLPAGLSSDEIFIERFMREARIAAQLEHPNIARIYQVDREQGICFFIMQFLPGGTLRDTIERDDTVPPADMVRWGTDVCLALEYAHDCDVVHSDLKPANIGFDRDKRAVVLDFGIARAARDLDLVSQGVVAGTPHYMSPEQAWGRDIDHRSDIYALGVVLYEMATGKLPFEADDEFDLMCRMVREAPEPPNKRNPELPLWLDEIIMTCLRPDPDMRFKNIESLRHALSGQTDRKSTFMTSSSDITGRNTVLPLFMRKKIHGATDAAGTAGDRSWKPMCRGNVAPEVIDDFNHVIDTMPELPVHVRELLVELSQEDVEADKVVDVVSSDPAIVFNLLKTVNSSFYGLERKTENIRFAIFYLGLDTVRRIALKTGLSNVFTGDSSHAGYTVRGLWEHSFLVSSFAESFARSSTNDQPGIMTTFGILHDIGKYVLFRKAHDMSKTDDPQKHPVDIDDTVPLIEREEAIFSINHAIVGGMLAEKWGLSERVCAIIEKHHDPSYHGIDSVSGAVARDVGVICLSDLVVNGVTGAQAVPPEPSRDFFKLLGLEPPLENAVSNDLLMELAKARMFTAILS